MPARLVGEPRETKKERKEGSKKKDTRNSGKLAFRPDHPRRWIKIKLCMVGGRRCVVIHFTALWGQKWPFLITLARGLYNSLSTACTVVQAIA